MHTVACWCPNLLRVGLSQGNHAADHSWVLLPTAGGRSQRDDRPCLIHPPTIVLKSGTEEMAKPVEFTCLSSLWLCTAISHLIALKALK